LGRLIRKAFFASEKGRVLVDADYSQIELRLLADMSGDPTMVAAFNDNADIHAITASQVNGVPLSMVTPKMRSEAKAVNFGIVYGISEFGLAKDLDISWKQAKKYIDGYFEKYPQVHDFLKDLVVYAKRVGYAETPFGRRRYLPELSSSKYMIRQFGERVAMNMPIQGAAADIMKMAMVSVYKELKKRGLKSRMILQVHDELLIDAPEEEVEEVKLLLKDCMENVVKLSVPIPVSVSAGYCWDECK
jgi:DNA polymerase-1